MWWGEMVHLKTFEATGGTTSTGRFAKSKSQSDTGYGQTYYYREVKKRAESIRRLLLVCMLPVERSIYTTTSGRARLRLEKNHKTKQMERAHVDFHISVNDGGCLQGMGVPLPQCTIKCGACD